MTRGEGAEERVQPGEPGPEPGSSDGEVAGAVEDALTRLGRHLVLGLPLGLGKPNRLVNAFYRRAREDPSIRLDIVTALSLDPPSPSGDMERRFLEPFVRRHFGPDYPRLEYVGDLRQGQVPGNVRITEFYLQTGSGLGNPLVQRRYVSSNYTHVARDLVDRGVNLILQLVAGEGDRLSLSCNPDVTLDVASRLRASGTNHLILGQRHPDLPYLHGDAEVERGFFHRILSPDPSQGLFALPRTPVSVQDHWVGLHAGSLVADGGTLQIGIGSLGDALVHGLLLRQRENRLYRDLLGSSGEGEGGPAVRIGGLDPFRVGLYGASEMFMDGFMHLYRAGILKRRVFDDVESQRRALEAEAGRGDMPPGGAVMDGGFFLGSRPFYEFLRELGPEERPLFRMMSVKRINQLYGGSEELEVLQRKGARFFNTCMMTTVTGAAVSDGLKDHQVVSGVGGQYNFVAMSHAMEDGRSALMMKSVRDSGGSATSNVVWEYPHTTIPRHLRDLVVTEYGVAELRGRSDEECIQALVQVTDARFQDELVERAWEAGKLSRGWTIPDQARKNTPQALSDALARAGGEERFPLFPFGSDFDTVEEELVPALGRLREVSRSRLALMRAALRGRPGNFPAAMARMGLNEPGSIGERLAARALAAALAETRR
jgi:acyl-CoA hydrolase